MPNKVDSIPKDYKMHNRYSTHTIPSTDGPTKIDTLTIKSSTGYPWVGPIDNKVTGYPWSELQPPGKDPITVAVRHDEGKTNWSLMPFEALEEINKVLEFGANKYSANNWQEGTGFKYSRVLNSLLRHTFAFMRGEDKDPESGLSHMAHAGCNVLFILYYLKNKARYANDDRR